MTRREAFGAALAAAAASGPRYYIRCEHPSFLFWFLPFPFVFLNLETARAAVATLDQMRFDHPIKLTVMEWAAKEQVFRPI